MACLKRWGTDGARCLDTSWAGGAVGEALLGSVSVSALGKEVGLAVHTMRVSLRVGLQACVKQVGARVWCGHPPLDHGRLASVAANRSHADLVWAVFEMLSFLGDVAAHGAPHGGGLGARLHASWFSYDA